MRLVVKTRQGFRDFRNGLSTIFGKPKLGEGDRKLAKVGTIIESQISGCNKHVVRNNVIKDIERVLRSEAQKGGKEAVDTKLSSTFATPEYMHMLHRLGLEEPHVRVMAMEALKNAK